jgi:hypothetical protein
VLTLSTLRSGSRKPPFSARPDLNPDPDRAQFDRICQEDFARKSLFDSGIADFLIMFTYCFALAKPI